MEIYIVYYAKPGCKAADFVRELQESGVADAVRHEDGCLRYEYFLSADRPDVAMLMEQWVSLEHQQVHLTQPHMTELRAIKNKYIDHTARGEYTPERGA